MRALRRFYRAFRRRFFCARGRHVEGSQRLTSVFVWWDCVYCDKGLRYERRGDT